jgi:hypothetical protein
MNTFLEHVEYFNKDLDLYLKKVDSENITYVMKMKENGLVKRLADRFDDIDTAELYKAENKSAKIKLDQYFQDKLEKIKTDQTK